MIHTVLRLKDCFHAICQVLLRDPSDDNVIPVVEELRRRLPVVNDNANDGETGEEDGMFVNF